MKTHLFTLLLWISVPAFSQQKILKYSDHDPVGNMRTKFLKEILFKNIEKESRGSIKIEDHWNGELSTSYDALKSVAENGLADITVVVPEYVPKLWPRQLLFKSFPTGPSGNEQVSLLRNIYTNTPAFNKEIEQSGVKNLMVVTGYPVAFFSTKPIAGLLGLQGQKWRTASFWHQDFLKKSGATPVTMPWNSGITKALSGGGLDGIMVNLDGGNDFGINTIARHVLTSKKLWMGHVYLIVINQKSWDNLSKKNKNAITRAVKNSYKSLGKMMDESFDEEIQKLKNNNADVRILSNEELSAFQKNTGYKLLQQRWAQEQKNAGINDMPEILQRVTQLIENKNYGK